MLKLLYGDLYSYIRVRFTGLNIQYILNLSAQNGIVLKNVCSINNICFEADIYRFQYKKLKRLLGEGRYKTEIVKRSGLSFKIASNLKRWCLWGGIISATLLSVLVLSRTWIIKVNGYGDTQLIKDIVVASGLIDWQYRLPERIDGAIEAITSQKNVLWCSVTVKGAVVEVYIKEDTTLKQEESDEGDLVAAKDGVIRNLIVTDGTAVAKNGETVKKGQVLIESTVKIGENVYPVNAQGKALASVWYYESAEVSLSETVFEETGNVKSVLSVNVFGMNFSRNGKNDFEHSISSQKTINTFFLPISVNKITYAETVPVTKNVDQAYIVNETVTQLEAKIRQQLPENATVCEVNFNVEENDDTLTIGVYVETVEDIAVRG